MTTIIPTKYIASMFIKLPHRPPPKGIDISSVLTSKKKYYQSPVQNGSGPSDPARERRGLGMEPQEGFPSTFTAGGIHNDQDEPGALLPTEQNFLPCPALLSSPSLTLHTWYGHACFQKVTLIKT